MTVRSIPLETVQRAVITMVDDAGPVQIVQLEDEQVEGSEEAPPIDCETMFSYGFSAVPPAGSEAIPVAVGGDQDQLVVIAAIHHKSRPRGLSPGEVALHFGADVKLLLAEDGSVHVGAREPDDFAARASVTNARLDAIESKLNSLVAKFNVHLHPTSVGTSGTTPTPETTLTPGESVASSTVKLQS